MTGLGGWARVCEEAEVATGTFCLDTQTDPHSLTPSLTGSLVVYSWVVVPATSMMLSHRRPEVQSKQELSRMFPHTIGALSSLQGLSGDAAPAAGVGGAPVEASDTFFSLIV